MSASSPRIFFRRPHRTATADPRQRAEAVPLDALGSRRRRSVALRRASHGRRHAGSRRVFRRKRPRSRQSRSLGRRGRNDARRVRDPDRLLDEYAAAKADLSPIHGGRLVLRPFPTATPRRLAATLGGLRVAPWPCVYADLRAVGVRGEEAAERLREVVRAQ